jgi:hypothetical protein
MRIFAASVILSVLPTVAPAGGKLTFEDRVELTRGLTAEYATAKVLLPRSRKALELDAAGSFDKAAWARIAQTEGPSVRAGDMLQVTKIDIGSDRIELQINGGYNGGRKWYRNVRVSGGVGNPTPVPVGDPDANANAPPGTSLVILFHKPLEPIKTAEIKKILAPVMDFEKHSVTELYVDNLPPETQKAIREKRALVGMDREQVILALGRPAHKSRETRDGMELEDWVYGQAPGKITFVTFNGDKVSNVKESYAGLGSEISEPGPR